MSEYAACVWVQLPLFWYYFLNVPIIFLLTFWKRKKIQIWTNLYYKLELMNYACLYEEKLYKSMCVEFETKSHFSTSWPRTHYLAQASLKLWHSFLNAEIVGIHHYTQLSKKLMLSHI